MARSLIAKAAAREQFNADAIRALLAGGDTRGAVNRAIAVLQSESAKERTRRPAAMPRIDAEVAGWLLALAYSLRSHKPATAGSRYATPAQLVAIFDHACETQTGEAP